MFFTTLENHSSDIILIYVYIYMLQILHFFKYTKVIYLTYMISYKYHAKHLYFTLFIYYTSYFNIY